MYFFWARVEEITNEYTIFAFPSCLLLFCALHDKVTIISFRRNVIKYRALIYAMFERYYLQQFKAQHVI